MTIGGEEEVKDYKSLRRHVETAHLGLRFVCRECGIVTTRNRFYMAASHGYRCSWKKRC